VKNNDERSTTTSESADNQGGTSAKDSLQDLTALFVALGPEDRDALEELRQQLLEIALLASLPGPACNHAAAAADRINSVVSGEASDADAALAEAGHALELAAIAAEQDPQGECADVQAEPTPPADVVCAVAAPAASSLIQFDSPGMVSGDADAEILADYVVESLDHLASAETILVALESQPDDTEAINTVFRSFHTIKGTSGFLGLDRTQRLAHLGENLLSRARNGEIQVTGGYADLALEACDMLKIMVEEIRFAVPGGPLETPDDLIDLLTRLTDPEAHGYGPDGISKSASSASALEAKAPDAEEPEPPRNMGEILLDRGIVTPEGVARALEDQRAGDPRHVGEILVEKEAVSPQAIVQALDTQAKVGARKASDATIRVSTGRLDSLINMVGELVIAQSMIAQDPDAATHANPRLAKKVAHGGKITRELQDLTMALRMVPLKATFDKMRRAVRDLARKSGKSVQLQTRGDETEIDRNMVEALNDPLVHMIRNAVDHGIEPAEARRQRGKAPAGELLLTASHSAGSVVIELRDDGEGLDRERILAKAIDNGLAESGQKLDDDEISALIFQPGFSTAKKITDISGRGVGMDVVKRGVEALRGSVKVSSQPGMGSTFQMRLPLTMAITDAMVVAVGEERYLLPTASIQQSFHPKSESLTTVAGRGEVVMFRDNPISIVRLHQLFDVKEAVTDPASGLLIVVDAQGKRCALLADALLSQQQVVIKSLGSFLGQIPGVSGGAILGDGRVGLILDAADVVKLAHETAGGVALGSAAS
jgi:two-component system chemotaxis sensor kinase CheA